MMEYKGYVGKVEYDPDARLLHGEVVGIRDVVTFQAESPGDVEREFRASVDDYLAFCEARGERPDKAFSGRFVVRVDSDLHRKLNALAQASGRSLNTLVADYLDRGASQALSKSPCPPGDPKGGGKPRRPASKANRVKRRMQKA